MTDLRDPTVKEPHSSLHRYADPEPHDMRELNRRMQFWEIASGILCALFLWAPMAAAAFHRAV